MRCMNTATNAQSAVSASAASTRAGSFTPLRARSAKRTTHRAPAGAHTCIGTRGVTKVGTAQFRIATGSRGSHEATPLTEEDYCDA